MDVGRGGAGRFPVRELRIPGLARPLLTERGLTLIELLMVVAIIGVLSAVAVPQFYSYRQTAYDARAKSDLRNAANAEEAYFLINGDYLDCSNTVCQNQLPDFRLSNTVTINIRADNGAQPTFTGTAYSSGGARTFTYDSAAGGIQ